MIKERTHQEIRKEDDAYGTGTTPTPSNPKQPDNWAIAIIVAAVALIAAAVILM